MAADSDYVLAQLSAAGVEFAGADGVVRVANKHCSYTFRVGQKQRVTRAYEWMRFLTTFMHNGQPIFELASTSSENTATATAAKETK